MKRIKRFPGKIDIEAMYRNYRVYEGGKCTKINHAHICEYDDESTDRHHYDLAECRKNEAGNTVCNLESYGYWYKPDEVYIRWFHATPGFRGYGGSLYKQLERYLAKVKGVNTISLHSMWSAVEFWEKMGFDKLETRFHPGSDSDYDSVKEDNPWMEEYGDIPPYQKEISRIHPKWKKKVVWHELKSEEDIARMLKKEKPLPQRRIIRGVPKTRLHERKIGYWDRPPLRTRQKSLMHWK